MLFRAKEGSSTFSIDSVNLIINLFFEADRPSNVDIVDFYEMDNFFPGVTCFLVKA